jgi:hypothetical protein
MFLSTLNEVVLVAFNLAIDNHTERNHQGLGNRIINPRPSDFQGTGKMERQQRLGGMLNYYCRPAA